jgi:hypothetical protein
MKHCSLTIRIPPLIFSIPWSMPPPVVDFLREHNITPVLMFSVASFEYAGALARFFVIHQLHYLHYGS